MKIYVDGNPNEVCCVCTGEADSSRWVGRAKIDGRNTNNIAEYRAILYGLYKHPEATEVCSDSQLVVKQLSGEYAVKNQVLLYWWGRVQERLRDLKHEVKFTWVPRAENFAGKVLG